MADPGKREVLLVGSVPLGSAEQVFAVCADALDGRVRRLPDGETGPRTNWIAWQRGLLSANPALRLLPAAGPFPIFVLNPDHRGPVEFGSLEPSTCRANSMHIACKPRHSPRNGTLRSRANCAARILPSTPR